MRKRIWVIILFLAFIAAVAVPTLMTRRDETNPYVVWLRGARSDYKGMLSVWNVSADGSANISSWLRRAANEFEKENFGVFIGIETMDMKQFRQKISAGEYPDFVTHCTGTFEDHRLFEKIDVSGPREGLITSGEGYAAPLAVNAGFLLVNDGYLMEHEIEAPENNPGLAWIAQVSEMLTFEAQGQKGSISVQGFAMTADAAALAYGWPPVDWEGVPGLKIADIPAENVVDEFIAERVGMIFCSMRDYRKVYDKASMGEAPTFLPFALHPVSMKTHYISLVKTNDADLKRTADKFVRKLLSEKQQAELADAYQLPSVSIPYIFTEDETLGTVEKAYENEIAVPWCFIKREALDSLEALGGKALRGDKASAGLLDAAYNQTLVMP